MGAAPSAKRQRLDGSTELSGSPLARRDVGAPSPILPSPSHSLVHSPPHSTSSTNAVPSTTPLAAPFPHPLPVRAATPDDVIELSSSCSNSPIFTGSSSSLIFNTALSSLPPLHTPSPPQSITANPIPTPPAAPNQPSQAEFNPITFLNSNGPAAPLHSHKKSKSHRVALSSAKRGKRAAANPQRKPHRAGANKSHHSFASSPSSNISKKPHRTVSHLQSTSLSQSFSCSSYSSTPSNLLVASNLNSTLPSLLTFPAHATRSRSARMQNSTGRLDGSSAPSSVTANATAQSSTNSSGTGTAASATRSSSPSF